MQETVVILFFLTIIWSYLTPFDMIVCTLLRRAASVPPVSSLRSYMMDPFADSLWYEQDRGRIYEDSDDLEAPFNM